MVMEKPRPGASGRTRPHRSETRRRVLDAAFEVFVDRGIAASSINDVAEAAGLTKGAVYSNFAGKDDLVLTLMTEHAESRLTAGLVGFAEAQNPEAALATAGAALVRELRADAGWHRLLAEYFAMAQHDPVLRDALRDRRRAARIAVAIELSKLADLFGGALPLPPEELALVLFALSNGVGVESGIDPEAVPDDLLARVLALIFAGPIDELRTRTSAS